MIKLSKEEIGKLPAHILIPVECDVCKTEFFRTKKLVYATHYRNNKLTFCSKECEISHKTTSTKIECTCLTCGVVFLKKEYRMKLSLNHFCSTKCAAAHNSKVKKTGYSRSKLEKYIEEQLTILYPNLEIHYNRRDTIGSELDIYIPSLNLAIELNGMVHYEPIFGIDKLKYIQNNDNNKFQQCYENKINLCIIDVSKMSRFTLNKALPILEIIVRLINNTKEGIPG